MNLPKRFSRPNFTLVLVSSIPTVTLILMWMSDRWMIGQPWSQPASMAIAVASVVSVYCSYRLALQLQEQKLVYRHVESLVSLDFADLVELDASTDPKDLPSDTKWGCLLGRVRHRMGEICDRLASTEMQQAALEVRARRHEAEHGRIANILDHLTDPVLAVDEYDELTLANPRAQELFDLSVEPDEKKLLADLDQCQQIAELLTETRRRKSSHRRTCEVEISDHDGESRWYRVTTRGLVSGSEGASQEDAAPFASEGQGAVAILQDISAYKDIQKRNAEFVASVSHEMKTPLAGIKAYVELLIDGDSEDEETQEEFLNVIGGQADRLQRLVENLLNIARIEAGVVQVSKTEQSLNEVLIAATELVQPAAEQKQITLTHELSSMYLGVFIDRDMLLQAALNLLSNAVKYTPPGRKVTLHSRLVGDAVEFDVQDEGVGLNEEDQERIFEKFYRVQKDKAMANGTGLGLPLAKHIVEDVHQGQLSLTSEPGVGSTFTIHLPGAGQMN